MAVRAVKVKVEVPEGISEEMRAAAEQRAAQSAVLSLWEAGALSTRRAAEELGLSDHAFLDLLAARGIPVERGPLHLEAIEAALDQLGREAGMTLSAVIDANAVIGAAKGGIFARLASVYAPLFIPAAVRAEVLQNTALAGAPELGRALGHWITEVTPAAQTVQQFPATLSGADRQVLAVAREKAVSHVLTSDEELGREAARHGMTWLRVTDLLLLLKRAGHLPAARPVLDRMRQAGFGIEETAYQQALQAAGE